MNNRKKSLQYRIVGVSSEDPQYPSIELLNPTSNSKGWQTERFSVFPQQLIIQFLNPAKINSLQLLSHQCKISTKIEVYIAFPNKMNHISLDDIPFRKIGYFVLSSNEKNNFHSRELKTVFIDAPALFLKLNFMKPYVNSVNVFNQVGVIGLQVFGEELNQDNMRISNSRNDNNFDLKNKVKYDKKTLSLLQTLEEQKSQAIEEDDLLLAKDILNQIKHLKKIGEQLMRLEERKQIAIQNDDLEAAIIIKEEIMKLKNQPNNNNRRPQKRERNNYREENYEEENNNRRNYSDNSRDYENDKRRKFEEENRRNYEEEDERENNRNYEDEENDQRQEHERKEQKRGRSGRTRHYQNKGKKKEYETPEKIISESEEIEEPGSIKNSYSQQKEIQNFEDRPLPALTKNNKNNQMTEFPEEDEMKKSKIDRPKINKKSLVKLNSFLEYFEEDFLYFSFAPSWNSRNVSCEKLVEFLKTCLNGDIKLPNNEILSSNLNSALLSIWKLDLHFLEDRVPKITQNSLTILESIFQLKIQMGNQLNLKSGNINDLVQKTIMLFMEKMSDYKNHSVLEFMIQILLSAINSKISKNEDIFFILMKLKGIPKKFVNFKCLIGRLLVIKSLVSELGDSINKNTLESLLEFAAVNYENSNKDVRIESHNLILQIFKIIGEDKTLQCLESTKIRKGHLETLKQDFQSILENVSLSKPEKPKKAQKKAKKPKKKKVDSSSEEKIEQEAEQSHSEQEAQYEEDEREEEDEDEERDKICNFCKTSDENFLNNDQFDMHLWKECPMLATCKFCKQVVEISELNEHRLSECSKCSNFSKCPRCQSAVANEMFDEHTSEMGCKVLKLGDNFERCPLCKVDIDMGYEETEIAWRKHLVEDGCANNERTS